MIEPHRYHYIVCRDEKGRCKWRKNPVYRQGVFLRIIGCDRCASRMFIDSVSRAMRWCVYLTIECLGWLRFPPKTMVSVTKSGEGKLGILNHGYRLHMRNLRKNLITHEALKGSCLQLLMSFVERCSSLGNEDRLPPNWEWNQNLNFKNAVLLPPGGTMPNNLIAAGACEQ